MWLTTSHHAPTLADARPHDALHSPTSDCHSHYIMFLIRNGGACDRYGTKINLFRDVRTIFNELREIGISLAAASRSVLHLSVLVFV